MNSLKFILALGCMALLTIHQISADQEACSAVIEDVITVFKEESEDGGCFKKSLNWIKKLEGLSQDQKSYLEECGSDIQYLISSRVDKEQSRKCHRYIRKLFQD
ncbi:uncharacterized protein LOC118202480 isoform X2 [Stegodyphus dumicola]|uniref:uncharacterized protein LOC118202480 isoform X2 n=1 Tax=Stegodyphus dumicola TaxID=202533 RepID=UPI0015B06C96|nr:uncharacterized protein LOC118202480 isoform X2 [Stegodyphus dumicola]